MLELFSLALSTVTIANSALLLAGAPEADRPISTSPAVVAAAQPEAESSLEPSAALVVQEEEEVPRNEWVGSISAGGTLLRGNTDTTTVTVTGDAQYRRGKDRTTLGAWLNYGKDDTDGSTTTQEKYGARGQYDYFFTEKTYGLITGQAEHDKLADINLRWTAGAGVGQQIIDKENYKLSLEGGLNYFVEDYKGQSTNRYIAARFAYDLFWQINEHVEFRQNGQIFPSLEDSDDVYSRLDTKLDSTLTEKLFARLQWVWDWDNTPADGNKKSDHRIVAGLGWAF